MPQEHHSPIELPGPALVGGRPLRWTTTVIATAALFLLATNAVSIRDWANDLAPGPWQARLADAAEGWVATTDAVGLGAPRAWLHAHWKNAEAASFEKAQR